MYLSFKAMISLFKPEIDVMYEFNFILDYID